MASEAPQDSARPTEDEPLLGRAGDASQQDGRPLQFNLLLGINAPSYFHGLGHFFSPRSHLDVLQPAIIQLSHARMGNKQLIFNIGTAVIAQVGIWIVSLRHGIRY